MTRRPTAREQALIAVQYGTAAPDGHITPHFDREAALAAGGRLVHTTVGTPWVYDDTGTPVPSAHTQEDPVTHLPRALRTATTILGWTCAAVALAVLLGVLPEVVLAAAAGLTLAVGVLGVGLDYVTSFPTGTNTQGQL